jgi:hypothetical protein
VWTHSFQRCGAYGYGGQERGRPARRGLEKQQGGKASADKGQARHCRQVRLWEGTHSTLQGRLALAAFQGACSAD